MATRRTAPHTPVPAAFTAADYALPGTLARRYMRCGKDNCRCKADPPVLHGPYLHWTRTVAGKTVTRTLTAEQARRYQCQGTRRPEQWRPGDLNGGGQQN